ncbi:MAG: vanillic acid non-oxidative decarboxylation protein [Peptococcaceae bacterium]|nr:vanillic acid non-oxidative decarboxylation protein [Peptococcaceae bacterium]
MKCLRCLKDTAAKIAEAPDGSRAWEVFYCERCNYSWRTTEEEEIINLEKRDKNWQLDDVDLDSLDSLVPIPPLANNSNQ